METFHKSGGGSRVTKAIFCSRSLLTLVRRSSGIGKTERGQSRSGHNEIRSHIDKYQRTGVTGFIFFSSSTHHYFEKPLPSLHTTTQNGLSITTGRSRKNADGVKPEGDTEVEKTAARRRCTHRAGEDSVAQPTGKQEESWRLGRSAHVKKPQSALF